MSIKNRSPGACRRAVLPSESNSQRKCGASMLRQAQHSARTDNISILCLQHLDDSDIGDAAALAHRLQSVFLAARFQRMEQRRHQLCARCAERVAERDRAAVDVEPAWEIGRAPSELQSLMRISYAVLCLKKKNKNT